MKHPFQVGETYVNEKGEYEVISIEGPTMKIQWTDGSTWEGSVALQARILERIDMEREVRTTRRQRAQRRAASRADSRGRSFSGLVDNDFQDGITDTAWRRRESLGGLVARRLAEATSKEFQSYPVSRDPAVHIGSPSHYQQKNRQRQPRFVVELNETRAMVGFSIEKRDGTMDESWHWPDFLTALEGDPETCTRIGSAMIELGLDWRIWLPPAEGVQVRVGLAGDSLIWAPQVEGEPAELTWQGFLQRLREIADDQACELYLAADLPKDEALSAGEGAADRIAEVLGALVPLYEVSLR
jgi:hypothetical protein